MRKKLMILVLFALTAFSSVVRAECGSRATGDGCAGSLHCVEPSKFGCGCADPYCFSSSRSCISQAKCCHHLGNIGATQLDDNNSGDRECGAHCNDYSFNDDVVYKGTSTDYKGENS